METFEVDEQNNQPEVEHSPSPIPQEPVQPATAQEPEADTGFYSNAGIGRKESPYADSPYEIHQPEPEQPRWEEAPKAEPKAPRQEKKSRKPGKTGKKILAAVAAVALVAGSCGITAGLVSSSWERRLDQVETGFQSQLAGLQEQIDKMEDTGNSVSGSPVAAQGLTPSQVYARNKASVVAITNTVTSNAGFGQTRESTSSGSGFVYSADGYIVTNYHVVEGGGKLSITTYDGKSYDAELKGYEENNDLAVLKVETTDLQPVTLGSSDDLVIGDMVVAIGNPLGELTSSQTVGYISGRNRSVTTDASAINMLQTDAAINPGNSGGPLFNMLGQVIGITTAKYSGTTSSGASIEGIGFAIPMDDVVGMIQSIIEFGYVKSAYLGVSVIDMAKYAPQEGISGSYVAEVTQGTCAHKAGVQAGDVIVGLGEYEITGYSDLSRALRQFEGGEATTITVYRNGRTLTLDITLDSRPRTDVTQEPEVDQMPSEGDYDEWYEYFKRHFGIEGNP